MGRIGIPRGARNNKAKKSQGQNTRNDNRYKLVPKALLPDQWHKRTAVESHLADGAFILANQD